MMLAHSQGSLLNAAKLAAGLGVSSPTITSYLGLLAGLLLLRRLPPYLPNVRKRLVKSPKTYVRDSGLLHALLGIHSVDELLGHPGRRHELGRFRAGEPAGRGSGHVRAAFYRTAAGAEIDLVLELGGCAGIWAVEVKKNSAPKLESGFHSALEDLQPGSCLRRLHRIGSLPQVTKCHRPQPAGVGSGTRSPGHRDRVTQRNQNDGLTS
jgi:predicted AAA+ superfamily ATPase